MDLEQMVVKLVGDATSFDDVIQATINKIGKASQSIKNAVKNIEAEEARLGRMADQLLAASIGPIDRFNMAAKDLWKMLKMGIITTNIYRDSLAALERTLPENIKATEAAAKAQAEYNAMAARAATITDKYASAESRYVRTKADLRRMLDAGEISQRAYNRALEDERQKLPSVIAWNQRRIDLQTKLNDLMEQGKKLMGVEHYTNAQTDLRQMLRKGHIDLPTYLREVAKEKGALPSAPGPDTQREKVKQITLDNLTALEKYKRAVHELQTLRKNSGLSETAYHRALEAERKLLPHVQAAEQKANNERERGKQITQQLMSPLERYKQRLQELNTLLAGQNITLRTYVRGLRQASQEYGGLSASLNRAGTALGTASQRMRSAGLRAGLYLTAPITLFGKQSVGSFREFDKAMTYSLSIADNVTPQIRQQMEALATTMSERSRFSAIELSEAYYELISAGFSTIDAMKQLDTVQKFAAAGQMNLAASTKTLGQAVAAFGMKGKTPEETAASFYRVANVFTQAANMSLGSIEEMSQAFVQSAAPAAKIFGMSLEDTMAVLAVIKDQGESAATTSEHLAIALRLLGTAFQKHEKFWKQQGLDIYDATGKTRRFIDIIRDLQKLMNTQSNKGQVAMKAALGFEALQQRAFAKMLTPGAVDEMERYSRALQTNTAMEEVAGRQLMSFDNQMKMFQHTVQNVQIEIGEMLAPTIYKVTNLIKGLVNWWRSLDDESKRSALIIAAMTAAAGPLLLVLGSLGSVLSGLTLGVGGFLGLIANPVALAGFAAAVMTAVVAFQTLKPLVQDVLGDLESMARLSTSQANRRESIGANYKVRIGGKDVGTELQQLFDKQQAAQKTLTEKQIKLDEARRKHSPFFAEKDDDVLVQAKAEFDTAKQQQQIASAAFEARRNFADAYLMTQKHVADKVEKAKNIFNKAMGSGAARGLASFFSGGMEGQVGRSGIVQGASKTAGIVTNSMMMPAQAMMQALGRKMGLGGESSIGGMTQTFNEIGPKIAQMVETFKDQIAVQDAMAASGYKLSEAERQVAKIESEISRQKQILIDQYKAEGYSTDEIAAAVKGLNDQYRDQLKEAKRLAKIQTENQRAQEQFARIKALSERDPSKKFARELDDLNKAVSSGAISAEYYRKELRALRSEMLKEFKIDFKVGGIEALKHGTAETKAAIESFLMMQQEAFRPMPTAEHLLTGKMPAAGGGQAAAVPAGRPHLVKQMKDPLEGFKMNPEQERLWKLSQGSGPIAAEARRKLHSAHRVFRKVNSSLEEQRLFEMASKGGSLGGAARRKLENVYLGRNKRFNDNGLFKSDQEKKRIPKGLDASDMADIAGISGGFIKDNRLSILQKMETERLQGLAAKGGRLGFYAKQKLREQGIAPTPVGKAAAFTPSSAGASYAETKAQDSEKSLMKQIAKNTGTTANNTGITAKKKDVPIVPANLV